MQAKEAGPQRAASDSARGQGRSGPSLAPSVTFTDRWTMKRVQTGTTDLTSQPSMELGTTEDGEEAPDKQVCPTALPRLQLEALPLSYQTSLVEPGSFLVEFTMYMS